MFFSRFRRIDYKSKKVVNITQNLMTKYRNVNNTTELFSYIVRDGERPETVAEMFYNNPSFHWIILLLNDIVDPFYDWCLSQNELERYIDEKYGPDKNKIKYFVNLDDNERIYDQIDHEVFQTLYDADEPLPLYVKPVSYYEWEQERNEQKREIKLLQKRFIPDFIDQYYRLMEVS